MPYIKSNDGRRQDLQEGGVAQNAGELNYQIFYYVKHAKEFSMFPIKLYVKQFLGKNPNYQKYNDMTGCLIRCSREIKRRLSSTLAHYYSLVLLDILDSYDEQIAIYEDLKIIENSDVE